MEKKYSILNLQWPMEIETSKIAKYIPCLINCLDIAPGKIFIILC